MIEDSKEEYLKLMDSGMLFEFFPWATGNWQKDKDKFFIKSKIRSVDAEVRGDNLDATKVPEAKGIEHYAGNSWADNEDEILDKIVESRAKTSYDAPPLKTYIDEMGVTNTLSSPDKGLRYNQGKTRHDLVPQFAQEQYAKVLTKGAEKYADRNWELGMRWSKVVASLKRHLAAFERGEDFDPETGLHHTAHIMCNAGFLTEYYKIYPQGDDRPHSYLRRPKIGLDIDEVLCDWVGGWIEKFGRHSHKVEEVENWNFSYHTAKQFASFREDEMNEFYLNLKPKIQPSEIPFEPHCYITSRSVPAELTQQWLQLHGFATVPVYSLGFGESKVDVAKKSGIDLFVDDRFENFVELNNAGVCCYLLDTPHNKRYNVGYKRIYSLKELA